VPRMRREFGGCAGNIAYNLRLLGEQPIPMAAVGQDFAPYREHFDRLGIRLDCVREIEGLYTAQAFVTTDLDNNQITAFHPGAMVRSVDISVHDVPEAKFGIVAPDTRDAMLRHAREFAERGIPFIFDPGQAMPLFAGDDFRRFITIADWLALNDYEWHLLQERTGWTEADCLKHVKALIITRGGDGSVIHTRNQVHHIPCAKAKEVVDPTGCGDAYRAGLVHGILRGLDWDTTGRIASLMGAIKIAVRGTQNHRFTSQEFAQLYADSFGEPLKAAS